MNGQAYTRTMILGIILVISAVAVIGVGLLAFAGRLPGNSWVGIRVPEVRRDPAMWELAHKVAAPSWIVGGLALLLGGIIAVGASGWAWVWVFVAVIATIALIGVGAAMGAHTVAVLDAHNNTDNDTTSSCSCGGQGCTTAQPTTPIAVDIDAARRAAQAADS